MFGKKVITRFAPSPTGFLHVGGLRTALYNYLYAKKHRGKFLLRIEDTDQSRTVEGAAENLIKSLKKFGIEPDNKIPVVQSSRLKIYQQAAEKLIKQGKAYYCFCSKDRLEKLRKQQEQSKQPPMYDRLCQKLSTEKVQNNLNAKQKYVVRLSMPKDGETVFTDLVRGEVKFQNKLIDDQVIIKSDGFPTYHLASVVDDNEMKVTHVIRGEEWLSSTPKHILIYQALNLKLPKFAHLPLLLNEDKSKLSKRQGDATVEDFIKQGYLPNALLNFILLLGWNPGTEQEMFSLKEMIKQFSLEKINKAGAIFNPKKLDWLNGQYIRQTPPEKLTKLAIPILINSGLLIPQFDTGEVSSDLTGYLGKTIIEKFKVKNRQASLSFEDLSKIISIHQDKIKKIDEITQEIEYVFSELKYDPKILIWKKTPPQDTASNLKKLHDMLKSINESRWKMENLEKTIKEFITNNDFSTGDVLFPLRAALTGKSASPGPFEVADMLGKTTSLTRIRKAVTLLEEKG